MLLRRLFQPHKSTCCKEWTGRRAKDGSLLSQQGFDNDGNRTSLTNPASAVTAFAYDVGGRLTSMTTAASHVTTLAYDARSLLSTVTQPSTHATSLAYDDAARLSSTTDPVGTISLTRDADGRVLTVTEGSKVLTRVYDALGRVTSYTDGDGNVIGYAYDDIGRLTTLTYPDSKQVTYAYDTAGRLSTVTDWASRVTTYSYDAVGRVTQVLRPNGTKQTRVYDAAGQLTQVHEFAPDGTTLLYSGDHTYDLAGQLTGEVLFPSITPVTTAVAQTFDADNRLLTHNGAATTFDADGNLLSVASGLLPATYSYDARNRLTSSGGLTYTYDAENHRVALTDSSGTTHFAINPNAVLDQVLVRTAPDGTKTFYVYGLGLLHEDNGSAVHYYHHDRRGDTIALTDSTGTVTDRASYGVYGEVLSRTGTTSTPFLFNGKWGVQTDSNGIYYHRARYYHPGLRRFLNQDSLMGNILRHAGMNRFAYANGQPVTGVDPLGLSADDSMTAIATTALVGGAFGPMHAYGAAVSANAGKGDCSDAPNNAPPGSAPAQTSTLPGASPLTGPVERINAGNYQILTDGTRVQILVRIGYQGSAATPDVVAKFNQGIEAGWTGQFGKFVVRTFVSVVTDGSGFNPFVAPGDGRSNMNGAGLWYAGSSGWDAGHEIGHGFGLPDRYDLYTGKPDPGYQNNIMGAPGGVPSEADINAVLTMARARQAHLGGGNP